MLQFFKERGLNGQLQKDEQQTYQVLVRVTIPRVMKIDLQESTFKAHMKLEAQWEDNDPKLNRLMSRFETKCNDDVEFRKKHHQQNFVRQPTRFNHFQLALPKAVLDLYDDDSEKDELREAEFFAPRFTIPNMAESSDEAKWYTISRVHYDKPIVVRFNWFVTGTFQHAFDLQTFPFDDFDLSIDLKSGYEFMHPTKTVSLVHNKDSTVQSIVAAR